MTPPPSPGKDTTRTFVAVFPPATVAHAVAEALARVRAPGDGISWVKEGNVHYTLRFLGDLVPGRVAAARRACAAAVVGMAPFDLMLGGTGAFPDERRPRVLWLGAASGGDRLTLLARSLAVALEREGFPRDDKSFVPHLTLGRVRDGGGRGAGAGAGGTVTARLARGVFPREAFRVEELALVASTLSPGGSRYETLARCRLAGPPAADRSGPARDPEN